MAEQLYCSKCDSEFSRDMIEPEDQKTSYRSGDEIICPICEDVCILQTAAEVQAAKIDRAYEERFEDFD